MKTFRYCLIAVLFIAYFPAAPGCSNHYANSGTLTSKSSYPQAIERAKKDKWYIMLHSGVNLYTVNLAEVDKAKKQLTVQLDKPDSLHQFYVTNPDTKPYKPAPALSEMHLFMKDSASYTLDEPHTIALDKVARIELLK